ncbi:Mor transcription activator family protein [Desulforegula conservatrix]|uniref:Mor transcription activator family protein n=1 Tax=Desulforegula conservatrix TaxID=153026 RepID=UPI000424C323|nr:Mor transcription activator family protein [Desulforegula conservatrix]
MDRESLEPEANKHELSLDDLPGEFREIAEIVGLDGALKLVELCGGSQIYIPKMDSITRQTRYRQMLADFEKCRDYGLVARQYNLSEAHARMILKQLMLQRIGPRAQTEMF